MDWRHPIFFANPAELRAWLADHHATETELWIGFHKRGTGLPSVTWPEAVDQLLCFGWIDGVRKSLGDSSYTIRVTPRQARSAWSNVNIKRFAELTEFGLMQPAGIAAFEARTEARSGVYSFEQAGGGFDDGLEAQFRSNAKAWAFFNSKPPWYRRTATWWVISAKREETRQRRLAILIEDSANGRTIGPLTRRPAEKPTPGS